MGRYQDVWQLVSYISCLLSSLQSIKLQERGQHSASSVSMMRMRSSCCFYFGLFVTASCSRLIGAHSNAGNFTLDGTSYDCSPTGNLICWGDAHTYIGEGTQNGSLSLIWEAGDNAYWKRGLAYYGKPVRMGKSSTRQSASFNSMFSFSEIPQLFENGQSREAGDGIAFVISADNKTLGAAGETLGFFGLNWTNTFKSVVVEFDNYLNPGPHDISDSHVSLEFNNITYVAAKNTSDVDIYLGEPSTLYAWVEYSAATQQLEVRLSKSPYRPVSPLLNYTVDLFENVEEYMWVGFSGSTGGFRGYYYIGNWTFESYGIPQDPAPSPAPDSKTEVGTIVAVSVGVPLFVVASVAIFGLYIWFMRRDDLGTGILARWWNWNLSHKEDPGLQLAGISGGHRFSYNELSVATGGFSEESKLGGGGFGSVYRGLLPSPGGPVGVAVKKISRESMQGEKEFIAEVSIISQLRHRNLIQLLGWCHDKGEYLIVYELMPNQSLDKVLFCPDKKRAFLSWAQRINIVTGIAAVMDYLHQGWKQRVIHRDIKASNIMLDHEWNAKLGDFGLARLVDHERTPATTLVAGTYGYIAPEAAIDGGFLGRFTDKTDVFAFGAVALEIACGRKAFSLHLPPAEIVLVDWVWQRLSEGNLLSVVDSRLNGEYDTHWMEVVLLLGLQCSHPNPQARPAMRHVVQVLAGDVQVPLVPASKPVPVFGTDSQIVQINDLHCSQENLGSSKSCSS